VSSIEELRGALNAAKSGTTEAMASLQKVEQDLERDSGMLSKIGEEVVGAAIASSQQARDALQESSAALAVLNDGIDTYVASLGV
jgi:hypothetical protein